MNKKTALLIVDTQNDFCPGGKLAISEADAIIPFLNKYGEFFHEKNMPVFASRDWHPADSTHFKKNGGSWPEHCIRETHGAQFHPELRLPENTTILSKGMDPDEDGYSVFEGKSPKGEIFEELLNKMDINELVVGGLATDYCVKNSVIDALKRGYNIKICIDGIKGVDINPGDSQKAIKEMEEKGALKTFYTSYIMNFKSS